MNLGLNKFYDDSIDPDSQKTDPKTFLQLRCDNILTKLKKHNTPLYNHFMEIQLSAEIILQRWLKCIFTREFTKDGLNVYLLENSQQKIAFIYGIIYSRMNLMLLRKI